MRDLKTDLSKTKLIVLLQITCVGLTKNKILSCKDYDRQRNAGQMPHKESGLGSINTRQSGIPPWESSVEKEQNGSQC